MSQTPFNVAIVGAGFSGLAVAIALKRRGDDNFVILEKASQPGGTWRENTYPGCACDVRSHMYSFSYAMNPSWTRAYSGHREIFDYLRDCIDTFDLWPHIRFGTEFTAAQFDADDSTWHVDTDDGSLTASHLVMAKGPLHKPRLPEVPGTGDFTGTQFHSAQWNHAHDLTDKRVAVIGTGASAVQLVPEIAPHVKELRVIQRTPAWILPRPDRRISGAEKWLFKKLPLMQRLYRHFVYWRNEAQAILMRHPGVARKLAWLGTGHLRRAVREPELRQRLTPNFTLGCKRILLSNDFYPALARDNVHLVPSALARVEPDGVVTADGQAHRVDTLIYATGFDVTTDLTGLKIIGRDGADLRQVWRQGPQAHLGAMVAGFPNFFVMLGPNTGLGHNSMVFMAESQARYIMDAIDTLRRHDARRLEVRRSAQARYNDWLQARLDSTVWSAGRCHSWYLSADGVNRTLWPGYSVEFWWRTRKIRIRDYILTA